MEVGVEVAGAVWIVLRSVLRIVRCIYACIFGYVAALLNVLCLRVFGVLCLLGFGVMQEEVWSLYC